MQPIASDGPETKNDQLATRVHAPVVCMLALVPMSRDIRLQRAAPVLAHAGLRITIVDVDHSRSVPREESLANLRVRHVRLPRRLTKYYDGTMRLIPWLLFKLMRMFLCMIEVTRVPADVYHACDLAALPPCYIAARIRNKPLILETYELPLATPTVTRSRLLEIVAGRVFRAQLSHCSHVIVASPVHAQEMAHQYRIQVPTLVRNIPDYQPPIKSDRLRQYLRLQDDVGIALYQGAFQPGRGLETLVYAAKFLAPNAVIVLKGPGGESQADLETLIARVGVADRIKIVPAVTRAEMQEWAASADVGLAVYTPSYSRNVQTLLPNKVFEYLMAGLPILASNVEAVAEVVREYDVGRVVLSIEPHEVAGAINDLIADKEGRARMRQNALAACERELRWDVECHKLIQVYEDTLKTTLSYE